MADFASGLQSGFSTITQAVQARQLQDIRDKQASLEQVNTLSNIMKMAQTDPGAASVVMGSWGQAAGIDKDTLKGYQDFLTKSSQETIDTARNALIKSGLSASPADISTAIKGGVANLYTHIMTRQASEAGGQQADAATAAGGPPAAPAAPTLNSTMSPPPVAPPVPLGPPGGAPAAGGYVPPSPDMSTGGSGIGGGGTTSGEPLPAAVSGSNYNLLRGAMDDSYAAPSAPRVLPGGGPTPPDATSQTMQMPPDVLPGQTPRIPVAASAAIGAPPPSAMPGFPPGAGAPDAQHGSDVVPAQRAANVASNLEQRAAYLESPVDAQGKPKPVMMEAASKLRAEAESQKKNAVVNIRGDDPQVANLGFKPGAVLKYNLATHQVDVLQAGEDKWTIAQSTDPKYASLYASQPPGSVIGISTNGDIGVKVSGKETFTPLSAKERQAYADQGNPLDPGTAYSKNTTTNQLSPVSTGLTSDKAQVTNRAADDQKELTAQRADADKNQVVINQSKTIGALADAVQTGKLAPLKISAAQWASAFGLDPKKYVNVPAGEALQATLGKDVLTQVGSFAKTSDAEDKILQNSAGTITTTPQGIKLIRDLADFKAQNANKVSDLANSWDATVPGGLSGKVSKADIDKDPTLTGFEGKTYYQAKRLVGQQPDLPDNIKQQIQGLGQMSDEIKTVKTKIANIGGMNADDIELASKHPELLTNQEIQKLMARAKGLGLQ